MVFKLVAGVPGRPATTWNMPFPTYEYSLAALNTKKSFKHHYKSRIVQNWSLFKPTQVMHVFVGFSKKFAKNFKLIQMLVAALHARKKFKVVSLQQIISLTS